MLHRDSWVDAHTAAEMLDCSERSVYRHWKSWGLERRNVFSGRNGYKYSVASINRHLERSEDKEHAAIAHINEVKERARLRHASDERRKRSAK
jgi:hypothetical protein